MAKIHELYHRLQITLSTPPLVAAGLFSSFSILFSVFLFISLLVWLFFDLGLDQFRGKFFYLMVIMIGDFLFGFEMWGWGMVICGSMSIFLLEFRLKIGLIWCYFWCMYDYKYVSMLCNMGFLGDLDFICLCVCDL